MKVDDPVAFGILKRCMVARIATLSHNGRPSINPLYFIYLDGLIWLGTPDWTLAVRNIEADPRVSLLFGIEQDLHDQRVLHINGRASVRSDRQAQQSYNMRVARKYILTVDGIRNWLSHPRQHWLRHFYTAQSARKGHFCVIEVIPEQVELIVLKDSENGKR